MGKPRISIITVTYNASSVLEKTLSSVASQTYDNLEYVVVDGASKDDTLSIVDRWRNHIDILVSEPDKGLYDAMNKGARLATGDWILYMNADDIFVNEGVVADVAAFIEAHPEAEVVYGDSEMKPTDALIAKVGRLPDLKRRAKGLWRISLGPINDLATFRKTAWLRPP